MYTRIYTTHKPISIYLLDLVHIISGCGSGLDISKYNLYTAYIHKYTVLYILYAGSELTGF